ncbi:MAG TPA: MBL fold metallo-hydrolase [Acidimicrobiales bacterium]|nr:MBL fold metallo-hydrolase [Acidimicrobiales bacterium]
MADAADPVLAEPFSGVRRLRAPNPGPMTGRGTNSYLVGRDDLVLIDPGPEIPEHLDRLVELAGGNLRYVVVTHTHRDHSPGAAEVARRCGATLLGFGARDGFEPAGPLRDGDRVQVAGYRLDVLHTPGHASNHLCYLLDSPEVPVRVLFSGDHVMGGSTVVISPPDGDMAAYLASLERLLSIRPAIGAIAPGHGGVLEDPEGVLRGCLAHRRDREARVMTLLADGPSTPAALVATIYRDLDPALTEAAGRQLWAHLRKLAADGLVSSPDVDDLASTWRLSSAR